MRKNDHLGDAREQPTDLLHGRQRSIVIEARYRVVDDDDFSREVRVLVEAGKKERKRQSVAVSGASVLLNACCPGAASAVTGTTTLLIRRLYEHAEPPRVFVGWICSSLKPALKRARYWLMAFW